MIGFREVVSASPSEAYCENACRAGTTTAYSFGSKITSEHMNYNMEFYSAECDPTGPSSGSHCVVRGGSWYHSARFCRSAYRLRLTPDFGYGLLGFRIAAQAASTSIHVQPSTNF